MKLRTVKAAFPHTIPVMTGYLFLGMVYGMYMHASGFSFWYPLIMAVTVYGGSLEFLMCSMLLAAFSPLQSFLMALLIQARHLFYGIAMLDRFKGLGWKRFFLIYGLTDETFSIVCSAEAPQGVAPGKFMLCISWLDHLYWIAGAMAGALLGSLLSFDTRGLDFVMTAMFTVILLDHLRKEKKPYTVLIGLMSAVVCLLIFGPDSFMLPTMGCILALLTAFRSRLEKAGDPA